MHKAGITHERAQDVSMAALALVSVLSHLRSSQVIFSANGLREGLVYDSLSPAEKRKDPLLVSCQKFGMYSSRFDTLPPMKTLVNWAEPAFDKKFLRLSAAGCYLSDVSLAAHEDYQARRAFERILTLPLYSVDHPGRAFLAMMQYTRYGGGHNITFVRTAQNILGTQGMRAARLAGLACRMGYILTGGALTLLKHSELVVTPKRLTLKLGKKAQLLAAHNVGQVMDDLARRMGRRSHIKTI